MNEQIPRPALTVNPDLFRQNFNKPSEEATLKIAAIKAKAQELYELIYTTAPEGRERALGITHLEDSIMWVVKGMTS